MTIPRILYDTRFRDDGVVLAYSAAEVEGFEKENAVDWKDFTSFRVAGGGSEFDATLAADGDVDSFSWYIQAPVNDYTFKLKYESAPAVFTNLATVDTSVDPVIGMKTFNKVTVLAGRKIRVEFALATAEDVRQLAAGVRLDSPIGQHDGIRPPNLAGEFIQSNVESVGGSFIGRDKIRQQISSEIELEFLQPQTFVRDLWVPLLKHAERFAFFYAWNLDGFPKEVVYAWSRGNPRPLNSGPAGKMSVSLPIGALAK